VSAFDQMAREQPAEIAGGAGDEDGGVH
jgi:hypothetical protein